MGAIVFGVHDRLDHDNKMQVNKGEILSSIFILFGVVLVTMSYQFRQWELFDLGHIMFPISFLIFAFCKRSIIITIPLWMWMSGATNSLITSVFYDVQVFGFNQKVSAIIMVLGVLILGIYYSVLKFVAMRKEEKQNALCKKDARDKYKGFVKRMDAMEKKILDYDKSIDNFLNKLTK